MNKAARNRRGHVVDLFAGEASIQQALRKLGVAFCNGRIRFLPQVGRQYRALYSNRADVSEDRFPRTVVRVIGREAMLDNCTPLNALVLLLLAHATAHCFSAHAPDEGTPFFHPLL